MAIRIPGESKRDPFSWKKGVFLILLFDFFHHRIPTTAPLSSFLNANRLEFVPTTNNDMLNSTSHKDGDSEESGSLIREETMVVKTSETPASIFYCTNNDQNGFGEARSILSTVLKEYDFVETRFVNGRERLQWKQQRIVREHRNHPLGFLSPSVNRKLQWYCFQMASR